MKREIKFKTWDGKRMDEDPTISEPYECSCYGVDLNYAIEHTQKEDNIFLQYTGLKDKNGVEIYEGDWITFRGKTIIVKWDRYRWKFKTPNGGVPTSQIYNHQDEIEVVGNNYEKLIK